jgi:tungstate transport system ATP-binding protein
MSLYRLDNVAVVRSGRTILDVDRLQLDEGLIYGLLGPNGAGKSTLLDLLAFLSRPDRGAILFDERLVRYEREALQALRREVVLVEQEPIMFSTSLARNVAFGPRMRGLPSSRRDEIVSRSLELVGLSHLAQAHGPTLSGGENRRAAIARALACDPRVLLLDEPTAGVDVATQPVIESIIRDVHERLGLTVIVVTHDHAQAERIADVLLHLEQGRIISAENAGGLSCTVIDTDDGRYCRMPEGWLAPAPNGRPPGPASIRLDPHKIRILDGPEATNEAGRMSARITGLRMEGDAVRIATDAGEQLEAVLPLADYEPSRHAVGREIVLDIPPAAVRFLD